MNASGGGVPAPELKGRVTLMISPAHQVGLDLHVFFYDVLDKPVAEKLRQFLDVDVCVGLNFLVLFLD